MANTTTAMAKPLNILVSGSGIAGSVFAFWVLRAYPTAKVTIVGQYFVSFICLIFTHLPPPKNLQTNRQIFNTNTTSTRTRCRAPPHRRQRRHPQLCRDNHQTDAPRISHPRANHKGRRDLLPQCLWDLDCRHDPRDGTVGHPNHHV